MPTTPDASCSPLRNEGFAAYLQFWSRLALFRQSIERKLFGACGRDINLALRITADINEHRLAPTAISQNIGVRAIYQDVHELVTMLNPQRAYLSVEARRKRIPSQVDGLKTHVDRSQRAEGIQVECMGCDQDDTVGIVFIQDPQFCLETCGDTGSMGLLVQHAPHGERCTDQRDANAQASE